MSTAQISRWGAVQLMADLMEDAEREGRALKAVIYRYTCSCQDIENFTLEAGKHQTRCRYRIEIEQITRSLEKP